MILLLFGLFFAALLLLSRLCDWCGSTKSIEIEFSSDGQIWRDSVKTKLKDRRGGVAKVKAIQEELTLEQNRDDPDADVIEDKQAELELAKLNLGALRCAM